MTLLMVTGFAFLSRLTQIAPPSTRFVCLGCRGYASGFLPTPPHGDAVASGSELAPPLPPGDFHPQSVAHAGRTQGDAALRRRARPRLAPGVRPYGPTRRGSAGPVSQGLPAPSEPVVLPCMHGGIRYPAVEGLGTVISGHMEGAAFVGSVP